MKCKEIQSAYLYKFELYRELISPDTKEVFETSTNSVLIESLIPYRTYHWRVAAYSEKLGIVYSYFTTFRTLPELSVSSYPNPFNTETLVEVELPYKSKLKISVYKILGELVATLADKDFDYGKHIIKWNAEKFSSGIYFINVQGDFFNKNIKTILTK